MCTFVPAHLFGVTFAQVYWVQGKVCMGLIVCGQAVDVGRRQLRSKDGGGNADYDQKLQMAEQKMGEVVSAMAVLGKEAAAAMTAVEAQQQRLTLQRLIAMVCSTHLLVECKKTNADNTVICKVPQKMDQNRSLRDSFCKELVRASCVRSF